MHWTWTGHESHAGSDSTVPYAPVFELPFDAETVTDPPHPVKLKSPLLFADPLAEVEPETETNAPEASTPET